MGTGDVSEFKIVGMAIKIRFAGTATLRDPHESERLHLAQRWRDGFPLDAVALKVGVGDW
jgi:hypothetical protein